MGSIEKFYYHENNNIKKIDFFTHDHLDSTKIYDKNSNMILHKIMKLGFTYEEIFTYDDKNNMVEYDKNISSSKLNYTEKK